MTVCKYTNEIYYLLNVKDDEASVSNLIFELQVLCQFTGCCYHTQHLVIEMLFMPQKIRK